MKKKILVEDIERMVREEVTKRLSEQERQLFSLPDKALHLAKQALFQGFLYSDPVPGSSVARQLEYAGIDPVFYGRFISDLVDGKWKKDIEEAAMKSRNKNYKTPKKVPFDEL